MDARRSLFRPARRILNCLVLHSSTQLKFQPRCPQNVMTWDTSSGRQQVLLNLGASMAMSFGALLLLVVGEAAGVRNPRWAPGENSIQLVPLDCGPSREEQNDSSVAPVSAAY